MTRCGEPSPQSIVAVIGSEARVGERAAEDHRVVRAALAKVTWEETLRGDARLIEIAASVPGRPEPGAGGADDQGLV